MVRNGRPSYRSHRIIRSYLLILTTPWTAKITPVRLHHSITGPHCMPHQRPSTALITFWDGNSSLHLLNPRRTAVPLVTLPQKALTPQHLLRPIRTNQIALPLLQLLFLCPENMFSRSTQSRENMLASRSANPNTSQRQPQPAAAPTPPPSVAPAPTPTPAPSPTPASPSASRSAKPNSSQRQPQRQAQRQPAPAPSPTPASPSANPNQPQPQRQPQRQYQRQPQRQPHRQSHHQPQRQSQRQPTSQA